MGSLVFFIGLSGLGLWLLTLYKVMYHARIGKTSEKVRYFTWLYLLGVPAGLLYADAHQLPELTGVIYGGGAATAVYILIMIVALFMMRGSKMQEAYDLYDKYAAEGFHPVIITDSIFGPEVMRDSPPNLRTGMEMWGEGGKMRAYATATRSRYEWATQVWGDGPPG